MTAASPSGGNDAGVTLPGETTPTPAAEEGSSTGLIAGAASGAVVLVLALLVGAWVWYRRSAKAVGTSIADGDQSGHTSAQASVQPLSP
jgi:hypothetical protein